MLLARRGRHHSAEDLVVALLRMEPRLVCVQLCVCLCVGRGERLCLLNLCFLSLKSEAPGSQTKTDLEVTKAWSLMACTTSSNLILVVRVQPW